MEHNKTKSLHGKRQILEKEIFFTTEQRYKTTSNHIDKKNRIQSSIKNYQDCVIKENSEITLRLRKLGEPSRIFGENNRNRLDRLKKAESDTELDDELQGKRTQITQRKVNCIYDTKIQSQGSNLKDHQLHDAISGFTSNHESEIYGHNLKKPEKKVNETPIIGEKKEQNFIDNKSYIEDHCTKIIRKWCSLWKKDLLSRPTIAADSPQGRMAYKDYISTIKAFKYLFKQLKLRALRDDISMGIWLILQAMKEKNYLHADVVLLNAIAIGKAPWPIGVTQVGIHTKSAAREKISTSHSNKNAAAHIMRDEATRKYLHGLKRLLTVVQRIFPTDPSRSVEFNSEQNISKGLKDFVNEKIGMTENESEKTEKRKFD